MSRSCIVGVLLERHLAAAGSLGPQVQEQIVEAYLLKFLFLTSSCRGVHLVCTMGQLRLACSRSVRGTSTCSCTIRSTCGLRGTGTDHDCDRRRMMAF